MNRRFAGIAGIAGIAGLIAAASLAGTLHAQHVVPRSHTTGLLIGVGAQSKVIGQDPGGARSPDSDAGGQSITIGYGFSPRWALQAQIGRAVYKNSDGGNDWSGSADLELHRNFRSSAASRFVPFALVGVSSRTLAARYPSPTTPGATYDGFGPHLLPNLGGGANFYLARSIALRTSASVNVGKFDIRAADGTERAALRVLSPRLSLGLMVSPGAWTRRK